MSSKKNKIKKIENMYVFGTSNKTPQKVTNYTQQKAQNMFLRM